MKKTDLIYCAVWNHKGLWNHTDDCMPFVLKTIFTFDPIKVQSLLIRNMVSNSLHMIPERKQKLQHFTKANEKQWPRVHSRVLLFRFSLLIDRVCTSSDTLGVGGGWELPLLYSCLTCRLVWIGLMDRHSEHLARDMVQPCGMPQCPRDCTYRSAVIGCFPPTGSDGSNRRPKLVRGIDR